MFSSVLIPVDLSNSSSAKSMIQLAKQVAGKGAKIRLLNVIESIPQYIAVEIPFDYVEKSRKEALQNLNAIASESGHEGLEVDAITGGSPGSAILDAAESWGVDLIIIASHKPGLENYFLGSTAARVVRHAKCAVLVMR
jgi:universal stress protein F